MYASAVDTYYEYVKARVLAVNPARRFMGLMDAQDWPPKPVNFTAVYLLTLGDVPLGKQADSATIPVKVHTLQWTWMVLGTEIQTGIQARSRGSRYRDHFTIKGELEVGNYPGFGVKQSWALDSNGNAVGVPFSPSESIVWSRISFVDKSDKKSGVMYGTGTVRITDMTDPITS